MHILLGTCVPNACGILATSRCVPLRDAMALDSSNLCLQRMVQRIVPCRQGGRWIDATAHPNRALRAPIDRSGGLPAARLLHSSRFQQHVSEPVEAVLHCERHANGAVGVKAEGVLAVMCARRSGNRRFCAPLLAA